MAEYQLPRVVTKCFLGLAKGLVELKKATPHPKPAEIFAGAKSAFVIRSASAEVFRLAVGQMRQMNPKIHLHVLSHGRDEALITDICKENYTFHSYTGGGSYSWGAMKPEAQKALKELPIDKYLLLSNNLLAEGYDHIIDIIKNMGAQDIELFNSASRWFHLSKDQLIFKNAINTFYRSMLEVHWLGLPTQAPQKRNLGWGRKPKVVFDFSILNRPHMTGVERYTYEIGRELFRRGNNDYAYIGGELVGEKFKGQRARHINTEIANGALHVSQTEIAFWASQANADLVVSTMFPVPERKSFKTILAINDLIPLRMPEYYKEFSMYGYYDVEIRESAKHADAIITISEFSKKDIVQEYGVDPKKVHIITLGADERFCPMPQDAEWEPLKAKLGIAGPYLLAVCTANPHKNLPRVLQAFALLKQKPAFKNLQMVLVGVAGSGKNTLNEDLAKHPYLTDIIRTGHLQDSALPSLYRHCEALVWPSLYEGFGLPLLEAMMCGAAVVTSTLTSIPEVVGECAYNCDALSVESIAAATELALTDKELRAKKIAMGIDRAKKFSWKKGAEDMERIFGDVLQ